uniref:Uncharacterized protein n=1 Tax=Anguilla anguilla TaxID=7936 RepID=A0A0E9X3Z7_ANGAN
MEVFTFPHFTKHNMGFTFLSGTRNIWDAYWHRHTFRFKASNLKRHNSPKFTTPITDWETGPIFETLSNQLLYIMTIIIAHGRHKFKISF